MSKTTHTSAGDYDGPRHDHPHNDQDPPRLRDQSWVKVVCGDLNTAHDDDVQEILDHARYVLAMRDHNDGGDRA